MSITKADIIEAVQSQTNLTKTKSTDIIESFLEIIQNKLESGEDVLISGFGKFCANEKRERRGRSPATGDDLILKPRKVVTFKCSGKLSGTVCCNCGLLQSEENKKCAYCGEPLCGTMQ